MPISEDEFDFRSVQDTRSSTMSKAELRKTHKPIMEKRRRARINHCLNEIKTLILEAMNKDPARHSKLEKADILEMAVKHLQNVQTKQLTLSMSSDPSVLRKFKTGFNECANEIDRYVNQIEGLDQCLKERIKGHLQKCISGIEQVAHLNFPGLSLPFMTTQNVFNNPTSNINADTTHTLVGDQNNNARIEIPQGIHLIPSRLPSGELALLLPNSSNLSYFPTLKRPSAFVSVIPSTETRQISPPVSPKIAERSSPQGFRPVLPKYIEPQVPQVSSTQNIDVKTIKFPINSKISSPKKIEPLCIITNQNERYKQAQPREDSINFEENLGIKRKFDNLWEPQDYSYKVPKIEVPSIDKEFKSDTQNASNSKEQNDIATDNMWRPW